VYRSGLGHHRPALVPDINIVLEPPAADPGISPSDREVIGDLLAKGLLRGLSLPET